MTDMKFIARELFLVVVAFFLLCGSKTEATCTGASPTWSCSSWADLKALVEGTSIQSGDTATLAAGRYTANASITIPETKAITIRGVGTGASGTTIQANGAGLTSSSIFIINASQSRISYFNFTISSGNVTCVFGSHINWRADHNVFDYRPAGAKGRAVFSENRNRYCPTYEIGGLVDSNYFYDSRIEARGSAFAQSANAFRCHAAPLDLGGPYAMYVEDNEFVSNDYGLLFDADYGGSFVARFNTVTLCHTCGGYVFGTHPFNGPPSEPERGTRRFEIYKNIVTHGDTSTMQLRGGTGIIWGNTINASGYAGIYFSNDRSNQSLANKCDGVNAFSRLWDSDDSLNGGDAGWLCRDQPGAGRDLYAWSGSGAYPPQEKVPIYLWDNSGVTATSVYSHVRRDRDYYEEANGGVRVGTKAQMDAATCTAGQGFWVTDLGVWNRETPGPDGQLYKCTAHNTWTLYYTPYTYPHPLRGTGAETPPATPGSSLRVR